MSAQAIERQVRCIACGRRCLDYENAIQKGTVVIKVICKKCGEWNRVTLTGESG